MKTKKHRENLIKMACIYYTRWAQKENSLSTDVRGVFDLPGRTRLQMRRRGGGNKKTDGPHVNCPFCTA